MPRRPNHQVSVFAFLASLLPLTLASSLFATPWSFLVAADSRSSSDPGSGTRVNDVIVKEIAHAAVAENAALIVFPGDLPYGQAPDSATLTSELTAWRTDMQEAYSHGVGVYPVRGNHEAARKSGTSYNTYDAWNSVFSGPYALPANGPAGEANMTYSFTFNGATFIGLDTYGNLYGGSYGGTSHNHRINQPWFASQVAAANANRASHVFVFGHEPAFAVNHTDCLASYPSNRDAFWDTLGDTPDKIYFTAHDHLYNYAAAPDSSGDLVRQVMVGTGGGPLNTWDGSYANSADPRASLVQGVAHVDNKYGYLLVTVDGDSVSAVFKARNSSNLSSAGSYSAVSSFSYSVPEPSLLALLSSLSFLLLRRRHA